jgi:hypothetical protein
MGTFMDWHAWNQKLSDRMVQGVGFPKRPSTIHHVLNNCKGTETSYLVAVTYSGVAFGGQGKMYYTSTCFNNYGASFFIQVILLFFKSLYIFHEWGAWSIAQPPYLEGHCNSDLSPKTHPARATLPVAVLLLAWLSRSLRHASLHTRWYTPLSRWRYQCRSGAPSCF